MKQESALIDVTPCAADNRRHPRTRVLLGGVVATTGGAKIFDCTIRNLSAGGANFCSPMHLPIGDQIFLLDTRNHVAYLATIRWEESKNIGIEFDQTYDLCSDLPENVSFLEKLLIEAKLRQIVRLENRGVQLEHAADIVGLPEKHFLNVDIRSGIATEFDSLLRRLLALVENGRLQPKQAQRRKNNSPTFRFLRSQSFAEG